MDAGLYMKDMGGSITFTDSIVIEYTHSPSFHSIISRELRILFPEICEVE